MSIVFERACVRAGRDVLVETNSSVGVGAEGSLLLDLGGLGGVLRAALEWTCASRQGVTYVFGVSHGGGCCRVVVLVALVVGWD